MVSLWPRSRDRLAPAALFGVSRLRAAKLIGTREPGSSAGFEADQSLDLALVVALARERPNVVGRGASGTEACGKTRVRCALFRVAQIRTTMPAWYAFSVTDSPDAVADALARKANAAL